MIAKLICIIFGHRFFGNFDWTHEGNKFREVKALPVCTRCNRLNPNYGVWAEGKQSA